MDPVVVAIGMIIVRAAAEDTSDSSYSWAVPIVTALIVLVGTLAGIVMNKQSSGQRLEFERAQWEAAEAERTWKIEREKEDRQRAADREEAERQRLHAAEVAQAVETKCGECMDEVRRLMNDLDAATDRLLTAHRLIGQKDAKIETLEAELRAERTSRDG